MHSAGKLFLTSSVASGCGTMGIYNLLTGNFLLGSFLLLTHFVWLAIAICYYLDLVGGR